jgi:hypothetical protein
MSNITPPPELVQQWMTEFYGASVAPGETSTDIANRAAQWGADQELEACLANIHTMYGKDKADWLRSMRRPKPPSLKEQALGALGRFNTNDHWAPSEMVADFDTKGSQGLPAGARLRRHQLLRRALEALPE